MSSGGWNRAIGVAVLTWTVWAVCIVGVLSFSLPAYAEMVVHWGGTASVGIDARLYDDETQFDASGAVRLQARTLTYPWRVFFDGRLLGRGPMGADGSWQFKDDVDRLYLRLYLPDMDLTLGKQFVNWGVGYAWSPTDVFNPPDPTDPDGVRRGIVAAVAQIPIGPLDYWTIALADERYGVRRRGNVVGTDWSVVAIRDGGDTVFGGDLKGDLGVGWHMSLAHRVPGAVVLEPYTTVLIGADYSWLAGDLFWVGEYLIQTPPFPGGKGESHTFQQLTFRLDEFSAVSGSLLAPLQGEIRWWNASYQTVLSARSELTVGLSLRDGDVSGIGGFLENARLSINYSYAF